jgi:TonB-linked SusC/RagA family outer membrane protein
MIKQRFFKGKAIPFAVAMSALLFAPSAGVLSARAAVQDVQQEESIKGTVVDQSGETIIGASVLVVGAKTATGTVTDFDGNFTLKVKPGTQLKISYVGYKDALVKAANGMKVTLEEEATMLQAVEIVAYGVQKKVTVTGALSSVKAEDLTRTPVSSVNNVLAGQLSGVTTVQLSGEPGSDAAQIFVRGKATFGSASASPLIQVDGVEREMWDIDPNEIESVTVLKDASATAVFGVRGANGVILITTKRGAEGKARITASTSFSALMPTKMVEMASSYDYAMFHNAMHDNDGTAHEFSQTVIDMFRNNSDPIRFPSMKWSDYIMKDVTLQTQHNVNIS